MTIKQAMHFPLINLRVDVIIPIIGDPIDVASSKGS
jgi:hypothetical protein